MSTNGWTPDGSTSWQYAPAGRYAVWINSTGHTAGDVLRVEMTGPGGVTVAKETVYETAVGGGFVPVDTFELGATRDGLIGPDTTFVVKENGVVVTGAEARLLLFRIADDTSLSHSGLTTIAATTTRALYFDAPTLDRPHGGIWGQLDSGAPFNALPASRAWEHAVFVPPRTTLWVSDNPYQLPSITGATFTYYPLSHTYVP